MKRALVPLLAAVVLHPGCLPMRNSVIAAHGNTDWHIDTANKFVTCNGYSDGQTVANCVPAGWTQKQHIHVGDTSTAHYYNDSTLTTPGDDKDTTRGIDQRYMLFFYAGHGSPTSWSTLGDHGHQTGMRLGNAGNGGHLRYYWQCSCDVFAHGPRLGTCPKAGTFDYACPSEFDGSADSYDMRNVFERWGPALAGTDLRMACGASTAAYCHGPQVNKIWDDYNNLGFDVADAFIDGLDTGGVVPLCIARGDSPWNNPLHDSQFVTTANPATAGHYYLQYLGQPSFVPRIPEQRWPPIRIPIWKVDPPPPPEPFAGLKLRPGEEVQVVEGEALAPLNARLGRSKDPIVAASSATRVRFDPRSGALYVAGTRKSGLEKVQLSEKEYVDAALRIVAAYGLTERDVADPVVKQMLIAERSMKAGAERGAQPPPVQKNVQVLLRRRVLVGDQQVPMVGEGGLLKLQLNNDGTLLNLAKVWRTMASPAREAEVLPFEAAREQALRQAPKPGAYKVQAWRWGYREATGNVRQEELRVVYEFELVPIELEERERLPPMLVVIEAQK